MKIRYSNHELEAAAFYAATNNPFSDDDWRTIYKDTKERLFKYAKQNNEIIKSGGRGWTPISYTNGILILFSEEGEYISASILVTPTFKYDKLIEKEL